MLTLLLNRLAMVLEFHPMSMYRHNLSLLITSSERGSVERQSGLFSTTLSCYSRRFTKLEYSDLRSSRTTCTKSGRERRLSLGRTSFRGTTRELRSSLSKHSCMWSTFSLCRSYTCLFASVKDPSRLCPQFTHNSPQFQMNLATLESEWRVGH